MVNLGDYVGHLLSEITKARMQADMETVRIARIYASDPLLKNFPVPRMRLPNLEMNVPVIISEVPKNEDESFLRRNRLEAIAPESERIIKNELNKFNITLNDRDISRLRRALSSKIKGMSTPKTEEYMSVAKEIAKEAVGLAQQKFKTSLNKDMHRDQIESLQTSIQDKLYASLISLDKIPVSSTRIKVITETSKIKEMGNIQNAVTLKLSVIEEAVEWATVGKKESLFSLDIENKPKPTEGDKVSETIRNEFGTHKVFLSSEARITKADDKNWSITDGSNSYKIEDVGTHLNVFKAGRNILVPE